MAFLQASQLNFRFTVMLPHQTNTSISQAVFVRHIEDNFFAFPRLEVSKQRRRPTFFYKTHSEHINVAIPDVPERCITEVLDATEDQYDGVIVNPDYLPASINEFAAKLHFSLCYWRLKEKKGVWLKLLDFQADFVPVALQSGFSYHHAEPGYVVLTYWLANGPSQLPSTSTHQIGVGGFVISDDQKVLVVKEKKGTCSGIWKLPTGFLDKSEDIFSGAVREVKEETGVDTSFLEVLGFRHAHRMLFDKSDLLFICMLQPFSFQIEIDESEIEDAKWMPLDDFMNLPFHREDEMCKHIVEICAARHQKRYAGFSAHKMMSKLDNKMSHLYCVDINGSDGASEDTCSSISHIQ